MIAPSAALVVVACRPAIVNAAATIVAVLNVAVAAIALPVLFVVVFILEGAGVIVKAKELVAK